MRTTAPLHPCRCLSRAGKRVLRKDTPLHALFMAIRRKLGTEPTPKKAGGKGRNFSQ